MPDIINYLPTYERGSEIFKNLTNSENIELQSQYDAIEDFKIQLSVDTATWGLDYYEKDLGIVTDYSKPYDYRRSVIKSKMRANGKCDRTLIKLTCDAYTNGDVDVSFNGHIVIKFTSIKGIPPNMDDLKAILEEIKPATKAIDFEYTYNTWAAVSLYKWSDVSNKTWSQLGTI